MAGLPIDAIKVVIRGTQVTVQDWSTAFWVGLGVGSAPTTDTMPAIADAIEACVASMVVGIKGHIWSTETHYTETACYYYPAGSTEATILAENSDGAAAGTLTSYEPTFLSIVASLRTPFSGSSRRGRMYLPFSANGIAANGQWLSADIAYPSTEIAGMLSAVNALNLVSEAIVDQACVVASFTKAMTTKIDHVICDSIPDVQRRRKDKLGAAFNVSTDVSI